MNKAPYTLFHAILLILIAVFCCESKAYTKAGIGYILEQPNRYNFTYTDGTKSHLNTDYSDYSFHAEHGIVLGSLYTGVYGSYSDGTIHKPYKIELFADYDWINTSWHLKTGAGYKVKYQDYVYVNGNRNYYTSDSFQDKISARIGLSKEFNDFEVGITHHSQWFRGAPFYDGWEYHKTELFIDYKWTL